MDIIFSLSSSHDWILMHKGNGNQLREHWWRSEWFGNFGVYSDVVLFRIKKGSRTLLNRSTGRWFCASWYLTVGLFKALISSTFCVSAAKGLTGKLMNEEERMKYCALYMLRLESFINELKRSCSFFTSWVAFGRVHLKEKHSNVRILSQKTSQTLEKCWEKREIVSHCLQGKCFELSCQNIKLLGFQRSVWKSSENSSVLLGEQAW